MKRYHIGDRLHRSFPLRLPLGPSLEAGSEDRRTEDEDRPLFSIQLACGTHRLVGLWGLKLKLKQDGRTIGIDLPVVNILKYGGHTNEIVAVTPKVASGP